MSGNDILHIVPILMRIHPFALPGSTWYTISWEQASRQRTKHGRRDHKQQSQETALFEMGLWQCLDGLGNSLGHFQCSGHDNVVCAVLGV